MFNQRPCGAIRLCLLRPTALNRLIETLDPLSGVTQIQYDGLDQMTRVTDPIGVATTYQVNSLGNLGDEGTGWPVVWFGKGRAA